jgi:hypothetical protein
MVKCRRKENEEQAQSELCQFTGHRILLELVVGLYSQRYEEGGDSKVVDGCQGWMSWNKVNKVLWEAEAHSGMLNP